MPSRWWVWVLASAVACTASGLDDGVERGHARLTGPPSTATIRAAAKCSGCTILHTTKLDLPETATEAYGVKLEAPDGTLLAVTLAPDGTIRDREALASAERAQSYARRGALTERAAATLAALAPDDLVAVALWLKVATPQPRKEELLSDPSKAATAASDVAVRLAAVSKPVVAELKSRGARVDEDGSASPLVRASLPAKYARELSTHEKVALVDLYDVPTPSSTVWHPVIGGPTALTMASGAGNICHLEAFGNPADASMLFVQETSTPAKPWTSHHARDCLAIIRNSAGPSVTAAGGGAVQYIAVWDGFAGPQNDVETWCKQRARVLNFGYVWDDRFTSTLEWHDMKVDWLVKQSPYPLIVMGSGNDGQVAGGEYVRSRAFNGLVIGGYDDKGTTQEFTDTLYAHSSWRNPSSTNGDRELPHLVAPAVNISAPSTYLPGATGTSFAAPQVSGTAMLMRSRDTAFDAWPEMSRAVLMATAIGNVDGASFLNLPLGAGVDFKDGVGKLRASFATDLANPVNYRAAGSPAAAKGRYARTIDFASEFDSNGLSTFYWNGRADASGRMRVVIAWDSTAGCNSVGEACSTDRLDGDLDLRIINSSGTGNKCTSTSWDNSWEACDFIVAANETFTIRVVKSSIYAWGTYMGVAWFGY